MNISLSLEIEGLLALEKKDILNKILIF